MRAFIFTGQGDQYDKMGYDLYENSEYARKIIDSMDLDYNFRDIFVLGKEKNFNKYLQSSTFIISIILSQLLKEKGIVADVCSGLSLGEYTALCYANVLSIKDMLEIIKYREKIMYETLHNSNSGMIAILYLDSNIIKKLCNETKGICEIANYNSFNQTVITGEMNAIRECSKKCLEHGAEDVVELNCLGAFHSSLLKDASKKLKEKLKEFNFKESNIPIYYNYSGNKSNQKIEDLLVNQLYNPVKFSDIISNMIKDGVDEFFVVGVGKAPRAFIKNIAKVMNKKVSVKCIEKISDIERL